MKKHMGQVLIGSVVVLLALSSACLVNSSSGSNGTLKISSLVVETLNVYPRGASEIKCVVSAPEGDNVEYTWSTDGGSVIGDGSDIHWEAPNEYGDYHVMVTAKDNSGSSAQATLTLNVIPRPAKRCCGG